MILAERELRQDAGVAGAEVGLKICRHESTGIIYYILGQRRYSGYAKEAVNVTVEQSLRSGKVLGQELSI